MANYLDEAKVEELWGLIGKKYNSLFERVRVATGSYVGTGETSSKTITVGFKPKVAIIAENGYALFASGGQGAANVDGIAVWFEGITEINTGGFVSGEVYDTLKVTQTETGLILKNDYVYGLSSDSRKTYYYVILG